jgi:hypothetical protein
MMPARGAGQFPAVGVVTPSGTCFFLPNMLGYRSGLGAVACRHRDGDSSRRLAGNTELLTAPTDIEGMNRLAVLLLVAGCGTADPSRMEADHGGADGLVAFVEGSQPDVVRAMMAGYGVEYRSHALIEDCPRYFPVEDRNVWHDLNGEHYLVDSSGRPHRAYAYLPPVVGEARSTACQTSVGQWGDAEDPSNDYDGGHLIGSQLGGWGRRANLVPQDLNFNRGVWAVLENAMSGCQSLPPESLRYHVGVIYPDATALVPIRLRMTITNRTTGDSVALDFDNTDGGGPQGAGEKTRGVAFLDANGCN